MLWRHNKVLKIIVSCIENLLTKEMLLFVDDKDSSYPYEKLPFNLAPFGEFQPDIVLIKENGDKKEIFIVELTVPLARNMKNRHDEKLIKYSTWAKSLSSIFIPTVIAFEVSADTATNFLT